MNRAFHWYDYITINIYWFALTSRAQVLAPLLIPLLVQRFVGEGAKGTYVGVIRLWALMAGLLVQALMGIISDNSTSKWGRRRPLIAAGGIGESVVLFLIGFTVGMQGIKGFWVLFVLYVISMVFSNTAQAGAQGLIPDIVPGEKRGIFSGVKALLELPLPLMFVAFFMGRMVEAGNYWATVLTLISVLIFCLLIAMFAPEVPQRKAPLKLNWRPFLRLVGMTITFTTIILASGAAVKQVMQWSIRLPLTASMWVIGAGGLIVMCTAIGLGVWISVRISIGKEVFHNRSYTWWVINRLAFLTASTNLGVFVLFYLQERFMDLQGEGAAGPAIRLIMIVGLFVLLAALPGGWLADRFGKKLLVAISGFLAASGALLVVIFPAMNMIYLGGMLIGMGAGLFYTSNWALGTEVVPQEQAGRYLGLSNLAGAGAGAIGAYIGGPIADHSSYGLLFSIYGGLYLISTLPLLGIESRGVFNEV